jgi:septal ring factor EnvC (AmiA/AmiB activator)
MEAVIRDLSAALDVNEHLRQEVEDYANLAASLKEQMKACEARYSRSLDRLQLLERELRALTSVDSAAQTVRLIIYDSD